MKDNNVYEDEKGKYVILSNNKKKYIQKDEEDNLYLLVNEEDIADEVVDIPEDRFIKIMNKVCFQHIIKSIWMILVLIITNLAIIIPMIDNIKIKVFCITLNWISANLSLIIVKKNLDARNNAIKSYFDMKRRML